MAFQAWMGLGLAVALSCSRTPPAPQRSTSAPLASSTLASAQPAVLGQAQFHLASVGSPDGGPGYIATTDDPAPGCAFEIRIAPAPAQGAAPFSFAKAALRRLPRSDCSLFLRRVATLLAFSGDIPAPDPAEELSCSVAILGTHQSRADDPEAGPSFTSTPPGNWTATKLFVADGQGEVFLNLNELEAVGELSIKDEGYAAIVVTELAKVLLPRAG